jgi:hypothetical protein
VFKDWLLARCSTEPRPRRNENLLVSGSGSEMLGVLIDIVAFQDQTNSIIIITSWHILSVQVDSNYLLSLVRAIFVNINSS